MNISHINFLFGKQICSLHLTTVLINQMCTVTLLCAKKEENSVQAVTCVNVMMITLLVEVGKAFWRQRQIISAPTEYPQRTSPRIAHPSSRLIIRPLLFLIDC